MNLPAGESAQRSRAVGPIEPRLERVTFETLNGFENDDHFEAWQVFAKTFPSIAHPSSVLRPAVRAQPALSALAQSVAGRKPPVSPDEAREFFERSFQPFRILGTEGDDAADQGFLTGYYEPVVAGSLVPTAEFTEPVLQRPDDLVAFAPGEIPFPSHPEISAARKRTDEILEPYPDRAAIESGAAAAHTRPIVWLRDAIEVFMIQVQGSAKVRLTDGSMLQLTYAGRNGQPYTSIGRRLIEEGHISAAEMSLATLKAWVRAQGQKPGEVGRAMLQRNRSYIFFSARPASGDEGPIGGAGVPLSALRSIAVDRRIWSYGLPFWVETEIPWQSRVASPFRRLMVAQDTGSAILGAARADVFFGSGDAAGARAGDIRHPARMCILLPKTHGV